MTILNIRSTLPDGTQIPSGCIKCPRCQGTGKMTMGSKCSKCWGEGYVRG